MGLMDRLNSIFKSDEELDELEEGYEEYEGEEEEAAPAAAPATPKTAPATSRSTGAISSGAALEMKIIKPERFDEVTVIGEHLLARRTVVLNLESANKETAKRIIDFLAGVVFAIEGSVKKVANATFVVTPKNVDVSGEQGEEGGEEAPAGAGKTPRALFD